MGEIWKDIPNYEGLYQVSNLGRVKSFCRKKEKLKNLKNNGCGYYQSTLFKNTKAKTFYIHTLVAEVFLDKQNFKCMPDEDRNLIDLDKLEVNHKDENKKNNCANNLEYCTHLYNMNYGKVKEKIKLTNIKKSKKSKKINQYDLDGDFIKQWQSMGEIQRQLGLFKQSIYACCIKKKKTSGGYIWKYASEVMEDGVKI